ncbi:hypothetical protein Tco_0404883 [Tanacetum coccineum]
MVMVVAMVLVSADGVEVGMTMVRWIYGGVACCGDDDGGVRVVVAVVSVVQRWGWAVEGGRRGGDGVER